MSMEANIGNLKCFMQAAQNEISHLRLVKREPAYYAFDSVAEETLSKAFALAHSVILLVENGYPEEALGLSRSIVECALNLRWISADRSKLQERAMRFFRYGLTVKNLWYWWVKQRLGGSPEMADIDRYAAEWALSPETATAYRHWSGEQQFTRVASRLKHPLSSLQAGHQQLSIRQTHDYFQPSCFVHCSQPGLDSYYSDSTYFEVHPAKYDSRDFGRHALLICNSYLHDLIVYSMFGMNAHLPQELTCLRAHHFDPTVVEYRFQPEDTVTSL